MASHAFVEKAVRYSAATIYYTYFGFQVPFLIDFLRSYEESSGPELRKAILLDVLAEQVQFLASFQGPEWKECTIEFRFINLPDRGRIEIFILGKAAGESPQTSQRLASRLISNISSTFPSRLYELRPITQEQNGTEKLADLLCAGHPVGHQPDNLRLFEYRRFEAEEIVDDSLAYVAYPFHSNEATLQRAVHFLAGLDQPAMFSAAIRPVTLSADERNLLGRAASLCRENEKKAIELFGRQSQKVDVQAGALADLYEHYLKSLQDPFILRASVAINGDTGLSLLSLLSSDFSQNPAFAGTGREFINKRGEFVEALDEKQRKSAWFNLTQLEFIDWVPHIVETLPQMARLRQLVDASSASGALRLPLPTVGGLPGIDVRPPSLFEALPEALQHPAPDAAHISLGAAKILLPVLSKHALIAGTIGSGKTNTVFQLLYELWGKHKVPFLVIEPVNAEHNDYRALGRYFSVPDELRIFTLGDEDASPLRFNPFEVPTGVILNAHLSGLVACFVAALPFGEDSPLPALFREAIRNVYFARGWFDQDRGGERGLDIPTLIDLRNELAWLIEDRYGRNTEVAQTMIGASVTRVNALINSSAGSILLATRSIPLNELFNKPAILEMRHLGSEEDRALMTGFLLLSLQEYCDRNRMVGSKTLNHVVVLEEAHNLMQEVEDQNSPKAGAVKFFTNMLAENRKYGQSFIVVEQIPTLLAQGAIKNTVTKVMHRMPGRDDVQVMGSAMNFKERHDVRAVCLSVGEAFFYTEGMSEAALIQIQETVRKDQPLSDASVKETMEEFRSRHASVYETKLPFAGCRLCLRPCQYRQSFARHSFDRSLSTQIMQIYDQVDPAANREKAFRLLAEPIISIIKSVGSPADQGAGAAFCLFLHLTDQNKRLANIPASEMNIHLQKLWTGENEDGR